MRWRGPAALAAAGIIAPTFEPVAKLAVGLVRGSWYVVRRTLIAVSGGYVALAAVGALAYLVLHQLGMASPGALAAARESKWSPIPPRRIGSSRLVERLPAW